MRVKKWGLFLFFIIILVACNNDIENPNIDDEEVLQVYTTIFPLEDFSKKIGGDFVNVTNIIPVGADAHTFEPTPKDLIAVAEGDLFIYNGAGLEGFAEKVRELMKEENVKIVEASKNIPLIEFDDHDDHEHEHDQDPHVWLDPILSISLAETIKDAFVELMPEHEDDFTANFLNVKKELERIDEQFRALVEESERDTFFVAHAGYGYWEHRYGLKQVGIAGISPTSEPSQRQLQVMIELATDYHIEYILMEKNIPTKVADVVKDAIGAESLYIHNLETIGEDDVKNGEDYFSLMEKNIDVLKIALQ